jgi:hypothetical protein
MPGACALLLLAAVLAGCGPGSLDDQVASFVADTGATIVDCGRVEVSCSGVVPEPFPAAEQAALACARACGTRIVVTTFTIEGDRIHAAFVRVPEAGGCTTTRFYDTRDDAFGPRQLTQQRCEGFAVDPANVCIPITTTSCTLTD